MTKLNRILFFLFPIFFALPDLVLDLGVINLRIDDLIIYALLILNIKKIFSFKYNSFFKVQFALLLYALISLLVTLAFTYNIVSYYDIVRTLGSLPFLLILPPFFENEKYRALLFKGALIGGIIYLGSIGYHYDDIIKAKEALNTYGSFKNEMGFDTLNPNTVATLSLIFAWFNVLGFFSSKKSSYIVVAALLMMIPLFVLARASSIGLFLAAVVFLLFSKQNFRKYLIYGGFGLLAWLVLSYFVGSSLIDSATNINVQTGQGFSGRYVLWRQGMQLALQSPILGHGFATEIGLYKRFFQGHMSHQIFLHYTIELGGIALFVFLLSVFFLLRERWKLYKKYRNVIYLVQFCLFLNFFVADLTGQLLYFNKYAFIIYAMVAFCAFTKVNTVKYAV